MDKNHFIGTVWTPGYLSKSDFDELHKLADKGKYGEWFEINKKRDVFALAYTIWYGVTGSAPFKDNKQVNYADTTQLCEKDVIEYVLGKDVAKVLSQALSESPYNRPTVEEMIEAFTIMKEPQIS